MKATVLILAGIITATFVYIQIWNYMGGEGDIFQILSLNPERSQRFVELTETNSIESVNVTSISDDLLPTGVSGICFKALKLYEVESDQYWYGLLLADNENQKLVISSEQQKRLNIQDTGKRISIFLPESEQIDVKQPLSVYFHYGP